MDPSQTPAQTSGPSADFDSFTRRRRYNEHRHRLMINEKRSRFDAFCRLIRLSDVDLFDLPEELESFDVFMSTHEREMAMSHELGLGINSLE
ncbi:hypothetical protein MMC07_004547 [Pseudocyphellaria aurata]|nr:hypothetical protein [Pseudocyphellaria aurata]